MYQHVANDPFTDSFSPEDWQEFMDIMPLEAEGPDHDAQAFAGTQVYASIFWGTPHSDAASYLDTP